MKVPGLKKQHQPRAWQCTSTEATWCPLCGTCTCGEVDFGHGCQLHGEAVAHGSRSGMIL